MTRTEYLFAGGDFPCLGERGYVLWTGGPSIERFSWRDNAWVEDREMLGIYIGKPLVLTITEEQAQGIVAQFGGTWTAPVMPELTPELERIRGLRAQMQANTDSIEIPPGMERLPEDKGTVHPFWAVPGEPETILWSGTNQMRVWRFDYEADTWAIDPAVPPESIGTRDTTPISEQEAEATIARNGGIWAAPVWRARW